MSTDSKKAENTNPRPEKQDERIGDLPNQPHNEKDADKVKGGQRPNVPRDL